ncbi:MAG: tetratricopeptide repeat protein, partial [Candidatus Woesearchaeota archaeon]
QNSEWNAAIEYLAYSTELQPKNVPALNNLAIAYIKTNQPQKALDTWKSSLKIEYNPEIDKNIQIVEQSI